MNNSVLARMVLGLGGLFGALGVMAAAGASHGSESRNLAAIATVCLSHGPVLVALGLYGVRGRIVAIASIVLALGTALFAADLLAREKLGTGLLPLLAPIGGAGMIGGWLLLTLSAVFPSRGR